MASLRVATPAYNTIYNSQAQQNPATTPVATKSTTMPGQPVYQRTAGAIQRQPLQPIKSTSIAPAPTYQKTAGTMGSYKPGDNWDANLAKIGKTVNKSSIGGYQNAQTAPANSPLAKQNQAYTGAQNRAVVQNPSYAGFRQSNLQEGFDDQYLKDLAASQIDPLKEQYEEALRLAGADFNRLGLRGSGFEIGDKYGSQPGSITSRYMQEVGNVARDVALRGAEAEREDRYRQAEMNEARRQNWAGFDTNLAQQNFGNQQAMFDAAGKLVDQDESARQYWSKDELDRDLATRDYQLKQMEAGMQADQQDEANRQWWSNFQQQQLSADDQAMMDRWKSLADLNKWNTERYDDAREFDAGNDLQWANFQQQQLSADDQAMMDRWKALAGLQQWDAEQAESSRQFDVNQQLKADELNAGIKNQSVANMINFLNSQNATAAQMQDAYWKSILSGTNAYNSNVGQQANTAAWLRGLF